MRHIIDHRMMAAGPKLTTQAGARQASRAGSLDDADFPVLLTGEEGDAYNACVWHEARSMSGDSNLGFW